MNRHTNSVRFLALVVALIYSVNLAMAATCIWIVPAPMPNPFVFYHIHVSTLGLIFGELGCAALWFNVSSMRLLNRIAIYVLVASQLALLFVAVSTESFGSNFDFDYMSLEFLIVLGVTCTILLTTSVALLLSVGRLYLAKTVDTPTGKPLRGFTIAQAIIATTVLAVSLGTSSLSHADNSSGFWLALLSIVSSVALLPTAGLLIGTSFRRLIVQMIVSFVVAFALAAIVDESLRTHPSNLKDAWLPYFCVILIPIFWLRVIRKFGFEVFCRERNLENLQAVSTSIFDDHNSVTQT